MNTFNLENQNLSLAFDRTNGSLVGLRAVRTGWEVLGRPHLGLSWRLLVPLAGRRNNPVFGEKQGVAAVNVSPDGRLATLIWDGVLSEHGGKLDLKLNLQVRLTETQAVFALRIDNHSPHIVENVYCPYLGDVQRPPGAEWFKTFLYQHAQAQQWSLWPTFPNLREFAGVDYPTQFAPYHTGCGNPMSPLFLLRDPAQGLYVGVAEPSLEIVAWHTELRPGFQNSLDEQTPTEPTIGGKEVSLRFGAVHLPFIMPGESRDLTPIALQAYEGGWQQGVDIYKQQRNRAMKRLPAPSWAREPHAWQQIHINSPEDCLRRRYRDLVAIGEDCAKAGVKAIQLVGWNLGGQDQGNPSHSTDPRLGSAEELKAAIAHVQAMGVKVIAFVKFTWADRATDWFRQKLIKLAIKDPYGDYYVYQGYPYQTATQMLDINMKRLVPMCFLSEEYLGICEREFEKVVELGVDGILYDECQHRIPALLCFDESHGHRYGASVYANDLNLVERFKRLLPGGKEFLFAGEEQYPAELEQYQLCYLRSQKSDYVPLSRYLFPERLYLSAVAGFNDRNMVNQCLMFNFIVSYEPYNFKGRLGDFPLTVEYGQKMDALRSELRDYFWDGEFRHEVGAKVTLKNGLPHQPYSVFLSRVNGKAGVVVCNYSSEQTIEVMVKLQDGSTPGKYRLVDAGGWNSTKNGVALPPCSAAVLIDRL